MTDAEIDAIEKRAENSKNCLQEEGISLADIWDTFEDLPLLIKELRGARKALLAIRKETVEDEIWQLVNQALGDE